MFCGRPKTKNCKFQKSRIRRMAVKDSNFEMLHFFVAPPSIANNNDHVANGDDLGTYEQSKRFEREVRIAVPFFLHLPCSSIF
jgi:hypothetical protein